MLLVKRRMHDRAFCFSSPALFAVACLVIPAVVVCNRHFLSRDFRVGAGDAGSNLNLISKEFENLNFNDCIL